MKRKIFVGMLILIMGIIFSMTAFALTEGDWEFQLLDNQVKVTKYIGTDTNVAIPETIYGCPVTELGSRVFEKVDDTIVSITVPSKVTEIPNYFATYNKVLKTVVLPEGIEKIDDYAFNGNKNLKTINLPSTLREIGSQAFIDCTSLTGLTFPASLEKIGSNALSKTGIKNADLSHCTKITDDNFGISLFSGCAELVSAKLPAGLTVVPYSTFTKCKSLTNVELPNSVIEIKSEVFRECTSLKQIILPVSLKEILFDVFTNCDSLAEVVIPYGTEKISYSFKECDNLKSLYIPDTVTELSTSIVYGSNNCIIYCGANSYAAEFCKKNDISYLTDNSVNSGITVYYNGTRISFHNYGQNPELLNSRTLVPLRSIFEAMGAKVEWDDVTSTATATRDGITVKIQIGANQMHKDNSAIPVDVPAQLVNDRTMVPVRVIAEAFEADVQWNDAGRAVLINE